MENTAAEERYNRNIARLEEYLWGEELRRRELSRESWGHVGGKAWGICRVGSYIVLALGLVITIMYALMCLRHMDYYTLSNVTAPMWETGFTCFFFFFLICIVTYGLAVFLRKKTGAFKVLFWAGLGVMAALLIWLCAGVFSIFEFLQDAGMGFYAVLSVLIAACGMAMYESGVLLAFRRLKAAFWCASLSGAAVTIGLILQMARGASFEGQNTDAFAIVAVCCYLLLAAGTFILWRIERGDRKDREEMLSYTLQRLVREGGKEGLLSQEEYSGLIESFFADLKEQEEARRKSRKRR